MQKLSLHNIPKNAINDLFKHLSLGEHLSVYGTTDHIVDRMVERKIQIRTVLKSFKEVINGREFCMELYETGCANGEKNFKKKINNIFVCYSIYVDQGSKIKVIFRTVI